MSATKVPEPDEGVARNPTAAPVRIIDVAVPTIAGVPIAFLLAVVLKGLADALLPGSAMGELRGAGVDVLGISKSGEWAFTFSFWPMVVGVALYLHSRFQRQAPSTSTRHLHLVLLAPAGAVLVPMLFGASGAPVYNLVDNPILLAAYFQLPVIVLSVSQRLLDRRAGRPTATNLPLLWLAMALAPASVGVVVALQHAVAPVGLGTGGAVAVGAVLATGLAAGLGALASRRTTAIASFVPWGFAGAGLGTLPLLLPPLLRGSGGYASPPGPDARAWAVTIAAAAVAILVETGLRRRFGRIGSHHWAGVSSIAVAMLLVSVRLAYRLPTIWEDDYHFGEEFVPGAAWHLYDQAPYVDLSLPRGMLMNIVPGLANGILNNGSAATHEYTAPVIALAVAAAAHLLLRRAVGVPAATAIVVLIAVSNGYIEGDLLVGAIIVWCLHLILHTTRSLLVGGILALAVGIGILAYPMMGLITLGLVCGVIVAGAIGGVLAKDRASLRHPLLISFGGGLGSVALMVSPVGPLLREAVSYVLSNAGANDHAFAMPLDISWRGVPLGTGQLTHTAFALGALVSAVLLWRMRATLRHPSESAYSRLALAAVPGVVAVVLSSRFMGRIDPSAWPGRSTWGTLLVLGLVVPSALFMMNRPQLRSSAWAAIGGAAAVALVFLPVGQGGMLRNALGWIDRPATWPSEELAAAVPPLGVGIADPDHLARLAEIAHVEGRLEDGEPVLNVTNRGALSTYFEWRNPIPYLAPFNIESAGAENDTMDALVTNPPQYVLVGPGQWFDWTTLTLRDPLLARWLMDEYSPFSCGTTTWATPGTDGDWEGLGSLQCPGGMDQVASRDAVVSLWARTIGAGVDLDMLPATWAEGDPSVGERHDLDVEPGAVGEVQTWMTLTTADGGPSTGELTGNLLVLDVSCTGEDARAPTPASGDYSEATRAFASWPVGEGQEGLGQAAFRWGTGSFVVPLDAYPTWYLRPDRSEPISLAVPTLGCSGGWTVAASLAER